MAVLVPNHHVIVPRTQDISFVMTNKITKLGAERMANVFETHVTNVTQIFVPFQLVSVHWVEVYINDLRVINHRYPTEHTTGIPHETYNITSNSVIFSSSISGRVTVIQDTLIKPLPEYTTDPGLAGMVIDLDNFQSFDVYQQRFTPARWASGQIPSVGRYGLVNTRLRNRVADSHYSEPIVVQRPHWGYVRITADRRRFLYVPNLNFQGHDCFQYTMITQHGQIGPIKTIYIQVAGNDANISHRLSANVASIFESRSVEFTLETTGIPPGTLIPYLVISDRKPGYYNFVDNPQPGGSYLTDANSHGVFIIGPPTSNANVVITGMSSVKVTTELDEFWTPSIDTIEVVLICDYNVNANVIINGITLSIQPNVATFVKGDCIHFTANINAPFPITVNLDYETGYVYRNTITNTTSEFTTIGTGTYVFDNSMSAISSTYCFPFECPSDQPWPGPERYPFRREIVNRLVTDFNTNGASIDTSIANLILTMGNTSSLLSNVDYIEGDIIQFTLSPGQYGASIASGTRVPYTISNISQNLTPAAFISSKFPLSGNFIFGGGNTAIVNYNTKYLLDIEDTKSFTINILDNCIEYTVNIIDCCPNITTSFASSTVSEGQTAIVYYTVDQINLPLYYSVNGGIYLDPEDDVEISADFVGNTSGQITTSSGALPFIINTDSIVETWEEYFSVRFYTRSPKGTIRVCHISDRITILAQSGPSPTPTPTPAPTDGCSIVPTISLSGTNIVATNPCAQDNTILSLLVSYSRAISTGTIEQSTVYVGTCLPPFKNRLYYRGDRFSTNAPGFQAYQSSPGGIILWGPEILNGSTLRYKVGAASTLPKGSYTLKMAFGGLANTPGQCQHNRAFQESNTVTFTVS